MLVSAIITGLDLKEAIYHRIVSVALRRSELGKPANATATGRLSQLGREFLGHQRERLSREGTSRKIKPQEEFELQLVAEALHRLEPAAPAQKSTKAPLPPTVSPQASIIFSRRTVGKMATVADLEAAIAGKVKTDETWESRIANSKGRIKDKMRALKVSGFTPDWVSDKQLRDIGLEELRKRLAFYAQEGVIKLTIPRHYDVRFCKDPKEVARRLGNHPLQNQFAQPLREFGLPPKGLPQSYWADFYGLKQLIKEHPLAPHYLRILHPHYYSMLTSSFGIGEKKSSISSAARQSGIPKRGSGRAIRQALFILGVGSEIGRRLPHLAPLIARHGNALPGMTPAQLTLHYALKEKLANNPELASSLDASKSRILFSYAGYRRMPHSGMGLAHSLGITPGDFYFHMRKTVKKLGIELPKERESA